MPNEEKDREQEERVLEGTVEEDAEELRDELSWHERLFKEWDNGFNWGYVSAGFACLLSAGLLKGLPKLLKALTR